jgi:hypothetical protein
LLKNSANSGESVAGRLPVKPQGVIEMLKKISGVLGGLVVTTGSAFAAVPAAVTTALTDAQADGIVIATAVFVAIVAMYAFKLMRKGL